MIVEMILNLLVKLKIVIMKKNKLMGEIMEKVLMILVYFAIKFLLFVYSLLFLLLSDTNFTILESRNNLNLNIRTCRSTKRNNNNNKN